MHSSLMIVITSLCSAAPAPAQSVPAHPSSGLRVTAAWYEIVRTPGITANLDTARVDRLAGGLALGSNLTDFDAFTYFSLQASLPLRSY